PRARRGSLPSARATSARGRAPPSRAGGTTGGTPGTPRRPRLRRHGPPWPARPWSPRRSPAQGTWLPRLPEWQGRGVNRPGGPERQEGVERESADAPSDRERLGAVAGGDTEALRALYERHAAWLLLRLARRCGDRGLVGAEG